MPRKKKPSRRARGTGKIRTLGPNKFGISVELPRRLGTKRQWRSQTVLGTEADAEVRLAKLKSEVGKAADVADDRLTVNGLLDRYLAVTAEGKELTTHDWYERNFRSHVRPVIGTVRVRDLTTAHIRALLAAATNHSRTKRQGEPLSGAAKRNVLVGISAALTWAMKEDPPLVIKNVAKNVAPPKVVNVERVVVDLANVQRLLAAVAGTELEAVVAFQIGTGLRRSETCALKWSDIDLTAGTVKVQRAAANLRGKVLIKSPKTPGSRRTEFLAPFVIAVLKKHHAEQAARHLKLGIGNLGPNGYVFDRWGGQRVELITANARDPKHALMWDPNELSRLFTRMRQSNKLPAIRLHDCRHGFATLSFAAGIDLLTVSKSLGHSSLAITSSIYVHQLTASKKAATDAFEAFVSPAVTRPKAGGKTG